tara:strand:+ start:40 stop:384 length:345 start_codon:yes stop_codon:yes gene_type:complete
MIILFRFSNLILNQSLKKLFGIVFLIFIPFALSCLLFFIAPFSAHALVKGWELPEQALSPEANGDNPLGLVIIPSDENNIDSNQQDNEVTSNNYPDLGSEQVFPFEPGLGNSAF